MVGSIAKSIFPERVRLALGLVAGLALLGLILRSADLAGLGAALGETDRSSFALACLFALAATVAKGLR